MPKRTRCTVKWEETLENTCLEEEGIKQRKISL